MASSWKEERMHIIYRSKGPRRWLVLGKNRECTSFSEVKDHGDGSWEEERMNLIFRS
jgi:hypothetical protein